MGPQHRSMGKEGAEDRQEDPDNFHEGRLSPCKDEPGVADGRSAVRLPCCRRRPTWCGHDFGGGVAWGTAMVRPDLVSRLAILNSVHPVGFEREMGNQRATTDVERAGGRP